MIHIILPLIFEYGTYSEQYEIMKSSKSLYHYGAKIGVTLSLSLTRTSSDNIKNEGKLRFNKYIKIKYIQLQIHYYYQNNELGEVLKSKLYKKLGAKIRKIHLGSMSESIMKSLAELQDLRELIITDNWGYNIYPINILPHLTTLITNQQMNNTNVQHLTNLRTLIAPKCYIHSSKLQYLKNIRILDLHNNTSLCNDGMRHLKRIKFLNLFENTNISDYGLQFIMGCAFINRKLGYHGEKVEHNVLSIKLFECAETKDGVFTHGRPKNLHKDMFEDNINIKPKQIYDTGVIVHYDCPFEKTSESFSNNHFFNTKDLFDLINIVKRKHVATCDFHNHKETKWYDLRAYYSENKRHVELVQDPLVYIYQYLKTY